MPDNLAECRLSPEAERDLENIWVYTYENWGISQANKYIDKFSAAFDQLANNPQLGTKCDHIRKDYRRMPIARHVIYYRLTEYGISVIRILHERMFPLRHFE